MADQVSITNLPDAGSREAVALEIWKVLRHKYSQQVATSVEQELALYARCRNAAFGFPPS